MTGGLTLDRATPGAAGASRASAGARPRVLFVVESGTDVRLVEGLAERCELTILARRIEGGVEISHAPAVAVPTEVGPAGRGTFARLVWGRLTGGDQGARAFDAVLVQGYGFAALAANAAARRTGTPTTMLVCSPVEAYYACRRLAPEDGKPFRRRELLGLSALARLNAAVGRQYVVLSEHLRDVVRAHGARARIDVVPVYGVDTEQFRPPTESKAALRAELGLPPSGALLFFSSRVAPEKDSETLLAAVRQLRDAGRDVWVLHRSGGYRAFVRRAGDFGVADRVVATDAVRPDAGLARDYQASDVCVQASREEGLGFSPLEALACGVPVVATAVGGLRETVRDGRTGWTYPVGDVGALAQCIAAALDDPAEAERRAANGRKFVRDRYERRLVFGQLASVLGARDATNAGRGNGRHATAA